MLNGETGLAGGETERWPEVKDTWGECSLLHFKRSKVKSEHNNKKMTNEVKNWRD